MSIEVFFLILSALSTGYGIFSVLNRGRMESEIVWFLLAVYFLVPWFVKDRLLPWYAFPLYLLPVAVLFGSIVYLAVKNREYAKIGAGLSSKNAVILGCMVGSLAFQFREDAAYQYLMMNPESIAVCSGGQGSDEPVSEAQAFFDHLILRGIAKERLILEDRSESTFENLKNSRTLLPDPEDQAAIITQEYHVTRSLMIARKAGYKNPAAIAAYSVPIHQPNYLLREVLAIVYGKLRGTL